ncbi:HD domain-containing protein [Micromonospora sp. DR5-3]|uniref:HD domain-containing protein n=1 Tax=unclassified Micromonospora TaxID=2617518 RepID=UPI0011D716E7|nr:MULTISPECIES: HD domain-containing protein [unclassified Micromonospora]MCW3819714.1 HD domain-containing protein [Micromonospora sp. DR5-3]TYC10109.1 HD domain-containing protein [Micromonospora sp. MP36]
MTVLSPPRPIIIDHALRDARRWCKGHTIDDRPALAHAVRVAVAIGEHLPDTPPTLVAAALLHDVPDFAPATPNIYQVLAAGYGSEVPRIIAALQVEHRALDEPDPPVRVDDLPVLLVSTADKIVALGSLLRRARASGNVPDFFARRPALRALLPHFRAFQQAAHPRVPASMSARLDVTLTRLERINTSIRTGSTR